MRRFRAIAAAAAVAVLLASCGDSEGSSTTVPPGPPVTVFAPPTIAPVLDELAKEYEADRPGAEVNVVRQTGTQLIAKAKTAKAGLAVLLDSWLPTGSQALGSGSFGRNLAVIAVPEGNPKKITGPAAFANKELRIVVCGTAQLNLMAVVIKRAGVAPLRYTLGPRCAADAVAKVDKGELDAALFFRNNVEVPDDVDLVNIPEAKNVVVKISFVVMGTSATDRDFGEFLASDTAKDILTAHGYLP